MAELNIRMASAEDIPRLAALKSTYIRSLYRGFLNQEALDISTPAYFLPSLTEWMEKGIYSTALIEHEGVIGNYLVYGNNPKEPEKGLIYEGVCDDHTTPEEKRLLLDYCLSELRAAGHKQCQLWILVDNFRVRFLFESFGFRPDGARRTMELYGQELLIARYVYQL